MMLPHGEPQAELQGAASCLAVETGMRQAFLHGSLLLLTIPRWC